MRSPSATDDQSYFLCGRTARPVKSYGFLERETVFTMRVGIIISSIALSLSFEAIHTEAERRIWKLLACNTHGFSNGHFV